MKDLKPFAIKLRNDKPRQPLLTKYRGLASIQGGQVVLKAGEAIGEHSTKDREEVIVIFEGRAEVSSNKSSSFTVEKNSIVYVPPDTIHNVKNIGKESLRYIYIVSPV